MRIAAVLLGLLIMPGHATPPHPTGLLDTAALVGIDPDLKRVRCTDCHENHGLGDALLQPGAGLGGCLECHTGVDRGLASDPHLGNLRVEDRAMLSMIQSTGLQLGPKNGLVCLTCHQMHAQHDAAQSCVTCHTDTRAGAEDIEAHADHTCVACHDAHPGAPSPTARARTEHDPAGCLHCHGEGAEHEPVVARPGTLGHHLYDTDLLPEQSDPPLEGCASCHDPHAPAKPDSKLCFECHEVRVGEWERGGHGETVVCLDCHPAHEDKPASHEAELNPISQRCLACHSEDAAEEVAKKAPRVSEFEHPAPVFTTDGARWEPLGEIPLFSETGKKLPPGDNGDLACSSCHLTHAPDDRKKGTKRRRPGMPPACAACHGSNALPYYLYFHRPKRREHLKKQE